MMINYLLYIEAVVSFTADVYQFNKISGFDPDIAHEWNKVVGG